jgi:saccharopine dehydrogenase-like NADP-dependent oxidoreductase
MPVPRVLVLGAGLVARPLVQYLLDKGHYVVLVDAVVSRADKMIAGRKNGEARALVLGEKPGPDDEARVEALVRTCDLAVSLLPYAYHPIVARACIACGKHMVTTSYVSDAMKALDGAARAAGVMCLNEVGLDPGMDHMSAMRIIDAVKRRGGRVVAFRSYCGGLPAPDANDNPLGYKFSWAPRGVLLAGRNNARYLLDGRVVDVPNQRLFRDMHMVRVDDSACFEAYPNRDSISYIDVYGLEGIETIFRGTFRNPGWCDCLHNFNALGLFSVDEMSVKGKTYADLMRELIDCGPTDDLAQAAAGKLGIPVESLPVSNLRWLGLLSDRPFTVDTISPLDAIGQLMYEKLAYREGERDMIVLYHDFRVELPGGRKERTTSRLIDFGIPYGDSAMSRTVSLPAAIAVNLLLEGRITARGVLRPVTPDLYNPILDELATMGIHCEESTESY